MNPSRGVCSAMVFPLKQGGLRGGQRQENDECLPPKRVRRLSVHPSETWNGEREQKHRHGNKTQHVKVFVRQRSRDDRDRRRIKEIAPPRMSRGGTKGEPEADQ